jgi:hypothetical protein
VSSSITLNTDMLVKGVLLAGELTTAHLDTCATHCFLSKEMSRKLARKGHTPMESNVKYAVEQGNPLCITSQVHVLPLTMVSNSSNRVRWRAVLFIVADCGADVIICYPILRQGGIVDYNPPAGFEALLRLCASDEPLPSELRTLAQNILNAGRTYNYTEPDSGKINEKALLKCLSMKLIIRDEYFDVLQRYLAGNTRSMDHVLLQDISVCLHKIGA